MSEYVFSPKFQVFSVDGKNDTLVKDNLIIYKTGNYIIFTVPKRYSGVANEIHELVVSNLEILLYTVLSRTLHNKM
jgi:hypothetical protein